MPSPRKLIFTVILHPRDMGEGKRRFFSVLRAGSFVRIHLNKHRNTSEAWEFRWKKNWDSIKRLPPDSSAPTALSGIFRLQMNSAVRVLFMLGCLPSYAAARILRSLPDQCYIPQTIKHSFINDSYCIFNLDCSARNSLAEILNFAGYAACSEPFPSQSFSSSRSSAFECGR